MIGGDVRPTLTYYQGKNIPKEFAKYLDSVHKQQVKKYESQNAVTSQSNIQKGLAFLMEISGLRVDI